MSDIFLSYSHRDAGRAPRVVQTLEAMGWSVWWDRRTLVGEEWEALIMQELAAAKCVMVLWTDDSRKSEWVNREARFGAENDKLVQVLMDDGSVPEEFGHVQAANLSDWRGGADGEMAKLIQRVGVLCGEPEGDAVGFWAAFFRNDSLVRALLFLVVSVVTLGVGIASERLFTQPWTVLLLVAPLGVALRMAWRTWRRAQDGRDLLLQPFFAVLLVLYLGLFAAVGGSDLLTWKRSLYGFSESREGWKLPGSLRDWRYRVVPRVGPADLMIIDLGDIPPGAQTRRTLTSIIGIADREGALGVALDVYLPLPSRADGALCSMVSAVSIPVFGGYTVDRPDGGAPVRQPYAPELEECFGPERRGHLLGYLEGDGRVRSVPLFLGGVRALESLDLKVAGALMAPTGMAPVLPVDGLLKVVPPETSFPVAEAIALITEEIPATSIEGRFLLVGRRIAADSVDTPDGLELGTVVHGNAIHSLVTRHYFRTFGSTATEVMTLILCAYLLTLLVDRGGTARSILLTTGAVSAGLVLAAVVSAGVWLLWIDFEYTLAGLWGWTLLVLAARRLRPEPAPAQIEEAA